MKKSPFLVVLVASIALVAGCATSQGPTPTDRLLCQAIDSLKQGNTVQYKELVRRAYADAADDPFVINNMGVVAEMDGKIRQAKEYYWLAWQRAGSLKVITTNDGKYQGRLLQDMTWENLERIMSRN